MLLIPLCQYVKTN